jgi:hypothetical protein
MKVTEACKAKPCVWKDAMVPHVLQGWSMLETNLGAQEAAVDEGPEDWMGKQWTISELGKILLFSACSLKLF